MSKHFCQNCPPARSTTMYTPLLLCCRPMLPHHLRHGTKGSVIAKDQSDCGLGMHTLLRPAPSDGRWPLTLLRVHVGGAHGGLRIPPVAADAIQDDAVVDGGPGPDVALAAALHQRCAVWPSRIGCECQAVGFRCCTSSKDRLCVCSVFRLPYPARPGDILQASTAKMPLPAADLRPQ